MNQLTFALPLSIVVLTVSSLLATGQQPRSEPVIPPVPRSGSQPVPNDELLSTRPLDATSLASFLDVQGGSFDLSASGTQSKFAYRLIVYLEGKPVGQIPWQFDSTEWGRYTNQRFTIMLKNEEEGIKFQVAHNYSGAIVRTIKLESKTRPNYFRAIKNKDGSISLFAKWKDGTVRDLDLSSGNMVIVLETKEESEPAGADQPATKSADKVPAKD